METLFFICLSCFTGNEVFSPLCPTLDHTDIMATLYCVYQGMITGPNIYKFQLMFKQDILFKEGKEHVEFSISDKLKSKSRIIFKTLIQLC